MKKVYSFSIVLSLLLLACTSVVGQRNRLSYYEFGAGIGTLNYGGEIATTNSTEALLDEVRPRFKVFGKYHFNDWFGMGANIGYGWFTARDENHELPKRGFNVTTTLFNTNAFLEAHFIRFGKYHYDDKFTIFIKAGLGFSAWNPDLEITENIPGDIDIEPDSYNGVSYFGGLGVKFRLSYNSILTLEFDINNGGGDNYDGFVRASNQNTSNDYFGGISVSYSYAIF